MPRPSVAELDKRLAILELNVERLAELPDQFNERFDSLESLLKNGLRRSIAENTNFRLEMEKKAEAEQKKKDWWGKAIRGGIVVFALSNLGFFLSFLALLLKHGSKIAKLLGN